MVGVPQSSLKMEMMSKCGAWQMRFCPLAAARHNAILLRPGGSPFFFFIFAARSSEVAHTHTRTRTRTAKKRTKRNKKTQNEPPNLIRGSDPSRPPVRSLGKVTGFVLGFVMRLFGSPTESGAAPPREPKTLEILLWRPESAKRRKRIQRKENNNDNGKYKRRRGEAERK